MVMFHLVYFLDMMVVVLVYLMLQFQLLKKLVQLTC